MPLPKGETMEIYFQNTVTINEQSLTEIQYKFIPVATWIFTVVYLILGAMMTVLCVWGWMSWYMPFIFFLFVVYFWLFPAIRARKAIKQNKKFHNGVIPQNVFTFGEQITAQTVNASRTWEYYQLTNVYSLRHSYVLRFADKSMAILDRDGFTIGDFAEFKQFLRYKRPDLKIPE